MGESGDVDHDYPHLGNAHVEFHPQVNIQQDPEHSFRSDDSVTFVAPVSTQHPLEGFDMSLELGYGRSAQFEPPIYSGDAQSLSCTTYNLLHGPVDAGHMFGTSAMTTDAGMTMDQAVPQDSYQTFHRDPLHLQQEVLAAGPFVSSTSLELSNQVQNVFPVVSSSPYLYSFHQHRRIPSDFSTASGPMSGSMDLDSELFASESFDQIFPELQPPMNNLSPSFDSVFPSFDSHPVASDGSIFNASTAIPNSTWPVAGNYISQISPSLGRPTITTSPTAPIDLQLQRLGDDAISGSHEFLNQTNTVGFRQNVPERMSQQKAMEIIEISDDDKDPPCYTSNLPDQNNMSRPKFGPSRPVFLMPARKGGHKGPLSAQQKKQGRELRMQGICFRCRKMKVKCYGGFPCHSCRKNSKATLWVYPCLKAHFLDIIQSGPYFSDVAAIQKHKIEVMDNKCIRDQLEAVFFLQERRDYDAIVVGFPELLEVYCAILWRAAAKMMGEIFIDSLAENQSLTGRQIAEAPLWLTKSKDRVVPFRFCESGNRNTREMWIVQRILLCEEVENKHKPLHTPHDPLFSREGVWRNVLDTFAWIGKRYAEITLFEYLQHAANRLSSLSSTELSNTAMGFLRILHSGLMSDLKNRSIDKDCEKSQLLSDDYLDRKKRIRFAMFVYLKIFTDKLPPWSDFWKEIPEALMPADPDILKVSLASIEDYDAQAIDFYDSAKKRFDYFFHGRKIFPGEPTNHGKQTTVFGNKETFWDTISSILRGPYDLRSELEFLRDVLTNTYDPRFIAFNQTVEQLINREEFQDGRQPLLKILEAGRSIVKVNETIRQWIHSVLEMQPKFEEDDPAREAVEAGLANLDNHMRIVLKFDSILDG